MNRRRFVIATVRYGITGLALRRIHVSYTSAQESALTRPAPIDVGSSLTLVDYRIHPGLWPAVIGELRNDSSVTIDAPSISITYLRSDGGEGFSWLSPTIPVMRAGETVPLFGPTPDIEQSDPSTDGFNFSLCSRAEPGEYTEILRFHEIDVEFEADAYAAHAYWYHGHVWNRGEHPVTNFIVRGIVRDSGGRIAGTTPQYRLPPIPPNDSRRVRIQASQADEPTTPASPFPLLFDDQYKVEIRPVPYLYENATNQGCSLLDMHTK